MAHKMSCRGNDAAESERPDVFAARVMLPQRESFPDSPDGMQTSAGGQTVKGFPEVGQFADAEYAT
jgi:hypothetical protein